jgi:predicted RNA-binding Zn-ribbon protein involved in translation (DUF1610 family)
MPGKIPAATEVADTAKAQLGDRLAADGYAAFACPGCGGRTFVLQLGGRAHGTVSCAACGMNWNAPNDR